MITKNKFFLDETKTKLEITNKPWFPSENGYYYGILHGDRGSVKFSYTIVIIFKFQREWIVKWIKFNESCPNILRDKSFSSLEKAKTYIKERFNLAINNQTT